jgi:hypothetical protein
MDLNDFLGPNTKQIHRSGREFGCAHRKNQWRIFKYQFGQFHSSCKMSCMKTLIRNRFTFGLMGVIFCSVVDPVITSSAPATNGRPSAISQIAKNLNSWGTCGQAAAELAKLGPEGFAALTNGFSNKDEEIRGIIIKVIGEQAAFDSNTVARFMIGCLKDPYSLNRAYAARYLSNKDPALAIPALLPVLNDDPETNCTEILAAAGALSSYRTAARMAVPKLLTLWTNEIFGPNRKIAAYWQSGLMDALKGIDMEAAVQAETFLGLSTQLRSLGHQP